MIEVVFEYDEIVRRWTPICRGVASSVEARHAFNAVVLTCQDLNPELLNKSLVEVLPNLVDYRIHPAV